MTFHVGQKITPLNSEPWEWEGDGDIYPQFGVVYTVRGSEWVGGEQFLWLCEIVNEPQQYDRFGEQSFEANEFRPVVEDRKRVSFTAGAPKDSEKWDCRRKVHART